MRSRRGAKVKDLWHELNNGDSRAVVGIQFLSGAGKKTNGMDNLIRALVVLALLGLSVYRIVRYFRYGMARRVTAGMPSTLGVIPPSGVATGQLSDVPTVPNSRWARMMAGTVGVLVLAALNAVLCVALFVWPAAGKIPFLWRLFVVIFANFYLVPFAQSVGKRRLERRQAAATEWPLR